MSHHAARIQLTGHETEALVLVTVSQIAAVTPDRDGDGAWIRLKIGNSIHVVETSEEISEAIEAAEQSIAARSAAALDLLGKGGQP